MKEKDLQQTVIDLAKRRGFEFIYHTWRSDHSPAGFPDLILLKEGRLVVIELKVGKNNLSPEQYFWLLEFGKVTDDVYVWWDPEDWDEIKEVLNET